MDDLPQIDDDEIVANEQRFELKKAEKERRIAAGEDARIDANSSAASAAADGSQSSSHQTISLEEREAKWGFTLEELQSASKVVTVLFNNPSLFVGDPYLAESRLYTMISRDRKTKRENKDVYRQVMNEEKSRREKVFRQQDIETIRKTTMKRERDDALNALIMPPENDGEGEVLLLKDTAIAKEGERNTESGAPAVVAVGPLAAMSKDHVELWRLVAWFESLMLLEYATGCREKCTNSGDRDAYASHETLQREVAHYTAMAYRFHPHQFDSAMPPPLFVAKELDTVGLPLSQSTLKMKREVARLSLDLLSSMGRPTAPAGSLVVSESLSLRQLRRHAIRGDALQAAEVIDLPSNLSCEKVLAELDVMLELGSLQSCDSLLRIRQFLVVETGQCANDGDVMLSLTHTLDRMISLLLYPTLLATQGSTLAADKRERQKSLRPDDIDDESGELWWDVEGSLCPVRVAVEPPVADALAGTVIEHQSQSLAEDIGRALQQFSRARPAEDQLVMNRIQKCHTCKGRYSLLHPFYYSLCRPCSEFNYNKRLLARDLRGKVVLLTGCRIKIGYAMAVSLLRCGATLLGTTRFAHDAIARFQEEPDYALWKERLHLFSLDLRDMWMVTQFCGFLTQKFPKLFAIINNAAQTIARTPEYTATLRSQEIAPQPKLQQALAADAKGCEWYNYFMHNSSVTVGLPLQMDHHPEEHPCPFLEDKSSSQPGGVTHMDPAVPSVVKSPSAIVTTITRPEQKIIYDRYDTQSESMDLREKNSWTMNMHEVQGSEAAEVMAINALSPFVLNGKLKPLLMNREGDENPVEGRFIINVSAMEGQFYRFKQTTHPHTNMAKAALNMMTRTSAADYAASHIYMNSVDTGWITDESPVQKKQRRAEDFMLCPLDEVDAAARCLDLIYCDSKEHGKFWKDFHTIPW